MVGVGRPTRKAVARSAALGYGGAMRNPILPTLLLAAACAGDLTTPGASGADAPAGPGADVPLLGADTAADATGGADGAPGADAKSEGDAATGGDAAGSDVAGDGAGGDAAVGQDAPARWTDPTVPTADQVAAPGPYAVGMRTLDLVDASRPTPPNGAFPGAPERTLVTDVYYPAAQKGSDAPLLPGPWPLVVYSHGYMSMRGENADLLRHLASHGIVAAAPTFPLSSQSAPGGPTIADIGSQPGDVSFIIDSLAALSEGDGWAAGALASPPRVAAAGLSLGGLNTGLLLFDPASRDERIEAFAILAGPLCFIPPAWTTGPLPPTLLVYGDGDAIIPYEANGHAPFLAMTGPRALVTLTGGTHVGFASSAASLFETFPDPDEVGCLTLDDNLQGQSFGDLAARAGFAGERPDIDSCPAPCAILPPGEKMKSTTQAALLPLTAGAFLRAHFTGDEALRRFVLERLPHERPDVAVEGELGP